MAREVYAVWRCGRHELSLARPRIMGVLEVGPDAYTAEDAVACGKQMLDEGADPRTRVCLPRRRPSVSCRWCAASYRRGPSCA